MTAKIPKGSFDSSFNIGRAKVAVLPEPVLAQARTSFLFFRILGMQFIWTGVGVLKPRSFKWDVIQERSPSFEKSGEGSIVFSFF